MPCAHSGEDDSANIDAYIAAIGQRIRAIRSRRGMIRKDLSVHSGVSERYLAQAESGHANISMGILWRIAQALQVDITELLTPDDATAINSSLLSLLNRLTREQQETAFELLKDRLIPLPNRVFGVALIGLRGAGKTQLGQLLASHYEVPFIRLGQVIERLANMDTAEIFALGGQHTYRRLERQALGEVCEQHKTAVIEVGGSLVSQADTYQFLLDHYFTVWIKASAQEHMNRVLAQGDLRPMQGNQQAMDDLKLILAEREAEYRQAHDSLDTSARQVANCSVELIHSCQRFLTSKNA